MAAMMPFLVISQPKSQLPLHSEVYAFKDVGNSA